MARWGGGGGLRSYETGGLLSTTTPKTTRCRADTVKAAQEFTVTAETASPQVDVHKDSARAHVHAHSHTHMQTLAVNPTNAHLPVTLAVGF